MLSFYAKALFLWCYGLTELGMANEILGGKGWYDLINYNEDRMKVSKVVERRKIRVFPRFFVNCEPCS